MHAKRPTDLTPPPILFVTLTVGLDIKTTITMRLTPSLTLFHLNFFNNCPQFLTSQSKLFNTASNQGIK